MPLFVCTQCFAIFSVSESSILIRSHTCTHCIHAHRPARGKDRDREKEKGLGFDRYPGLSLSSFPSRQLLLLSILNRISLTIFSYSFLLYYVVCHIYGITLPVLLKITFITWKGYFLLIIQTGRNNSTRRLRGIHLTGNTELQTWLPCWTTFLSSVQ